MLLPFCDVSCVVELRKAETTSTSTNIRMTRIESFALFVSSDSFLNAFPRILFLATKQILIVQKPDPLVFRSRNKEKFVEPFCLKNRSLRVSLDSIQTPKEDKRKESVY